MLALAMVASALIVIIPAGASAAGSNIITTNNVYGTPQSSFTVDGELFFSVSLSTASAQSVTISLINTTSGSTLTARSVTTSDAGTYQSWVLSTFNFFDLSYYSPGSYKLQLTVGGSAAANATFQIAYPIYSSTVRTTLSNYVLSNSYYLIGSYIHASILTVDQFGNPMTYNTSARLYEYLYSGMANTSQNYFITYLYPNDYGLSDVVFYSGFVSYQVGRFNLTAEFAGYPAGSSQYDPTLGTGHYYLISPTLTISPYRPGNVFGQGTTLKFDGIFTPYSAPINATIVSAASDSSIYSKSNVPLSGGIWNGSFFVNYSVPDGLYQLTVTEASNNYTLLTTDLQFQALELSAFPTQDYYLPGEPATIFYTVTNTSNNAPGLNVNVSYNMNYTTSNGPQSVSGVVSGGVLNLMIPSTAVVSSSVVMDLKAVDSYGHNATETLYLEVSPLIGFSSTDQSSYYPSSPVIVSIDALAGLSYYSSSPVSGASVYVNVSHSGSIISSYSGTALKTNAQGIATYAFMLSKNASLGTYTVSASLSAYGWTNTTTSTFLVVQQPVSYSLQIVPGQSSYVGGQQFSATWLLIKNGTSITPAYATYAASIGNTVVAAGTNSNGVIKFSLPSNTNGYLYLEVTASDSGGNTATSSVAVYVSQAMLVLNPSIVEYSPSSVVAFNYHIVGSGFSSPVYFYTITDYNGAIVGSGNTAGGSFQFSVPKNPSVQYTIGLTATNKSSGGVLTQSVTIYEISGLELSFSLSQSSYVSGTYAPGQKVSINYHITSLGSTSLSSSYNLYVWMPGFDKSYREYTVSSSSGTVSFTIPTGLAQGGYLIEVYASSALGSGSTPVVAQNVQVSQVQPFWNYNVVGGISLGSVLMGIVTLIALAIAVIAYTGKKIGSASGPRQEPPKQKQPEEKSPAEEKPKEEPKEESHESGDNSPPSPPS